MARSELVRRPGPYGPGRRSALTALTDDWLRELFRSAEGSGTDVCLLAVGGHGRSELAPGSDLDLVLVHPGGGVADGLGVPMPGGLLARQSESGIRSGIPNCGSTTACAP